ncbi:MAG TPA: hypothetical protein VLW84_10505 [Terriglobales bacterium]|nr:hypothetical protein [Terriglobales bacterium]
MKSFVGSQAGTIVLIVLAVCFTGLGVLAQDRMSDKDVETTMKNLQQDSKKFAASFNAAIKKSTIRKTDKEKSGKQLVQHFQKQISGMRSEFKNTKKVNNSLPLVLDSASKIEAFAKDNSLSDQTAPAWTPVRGELDSLSKAFAMPGGRGN